jgi:hypothetical protein
VSSSATVALTRSTVKRGFKHCKQDKPLMAYESRDISEKY